jgi:hypothetical protein
MTIWTVDFWKATAERVLATALQVLVTMVTIDGLEVIVTDWKGIGIAVGSAAALSLIKSVLANVATKNGPSLTDSEQVIPPLPQPEPH